MALNLIMDIGGTRLKWAWHRGTDRLAVGAALWSDALDQLASDHQRMEAMTGTSLTRAARLKRPWPPLARMCSEDELARTLGILVEVVEPASKVPFQIGYTSGQPGSDRIAAAAACHAEDPNGSFIIVDAGTCITVDLLSPGVWRGGAILPGLTLQAASMVHAGLPELQPDSSGRWTWNPSSEGALGTDTQSALAAGIPRALHLSVTHTVRDLLHLDPSARIRITGGDAPHFEGLGGWQTFADPNLVLTGTALLLNAPTK